MSSDVYHTITEEVIFDLRIKGSKFIAYLFPILSEEDFKNRLESIRADHKKASHHCSAFRLLEPSLERSSDDGEPSGSAGKPILGQLVKFDIHNTSAIVVRYFGGTKLGIRGLIDAYSGAVAGALEEVKIIKKTKKAFIEMEADYHATAFIEKFVKLQDLEIVEERFETRMYKKLAVPKSKLEEIKMILVEEIKKHFGYDNIESHPIRLLE